MSEVIIYTKPDCPNCNIAKLKMYRSGIQHDVVAITNDDLVRLNTQYNKSIRSMPIIEVVGRSVYTFEEIDTVIGENISA